jgi:uncharacterized membrane protein YukC
MNRNTKERTRRKKKKNRKRNIIIVGKEKLGIFSWLSINLLTILKVRHVC